MSPRWRCPGGCSPTPATGSSSPPNTPGPGRQATRGSSAASSSDSSVPRRSPSVSTTHTWRTRSGPRWMTRARSSRAGRGSLPRGAPRPMPPGVRGAGRQLSVRAPAWRCVPLRPPVPCASGSRTALRGQQCPGVLRRAPPDQPGARGQEVRGLLGRSQYRSGPRWLPAAALAHKLTGRLRAARHLGRGSRPGGPTDQGAALCSIRC